MSELTHFDAHGNAHMVDVGEKAVTQRRALAEGRITMNTEAFNAIMSGTAKKGDVLGVARVAGIMAAKRNAELIPLCHTIPLTACDIRFECDALTRSVWVRCEVACMERTGVEMEALTGASVALLTIYDMCKAVDRAMEIGEIRLLEKEGGKSGRYIRV